MPRSSDSEKPSAGFSISASFPLPLQPNRKRAHKPAGRDRLFKVVRVEVDPHRTRKTVIVEFVDVQDSVASRNSRAHATKSQRLSRRSAQRIEVLHLPGRTRRSVE